MSAGSPLPLVQNNLYTKVTYFGLACSEPLQPYSIMAGVLIRGEWDTDRHKGTTM